MSKRHPVLTAFGLNVRRQREARELTQEALAEKASLHPTYVSGIERGVRNPSLLSIARIAKALDYGDAIEKVFAEQLGLRRLERILAHRHARSRWPVTLELIGNPILK